MANCDHTQVCGKAKDKAARLINQKLDNRASLIYELFNRAARQKAINAQVAGR